MRKALIASLGPRRRARVAAAATGTAAPPPAQPAIPGCANGSLNLVDVRHAHGRRRQPAFPPWFGGDEKKPWKVSDPTSGKGYESAVAYAVAKQLGFAKSAGEVDVRAVQQLVPAGQEAVRLLPQRRSRTRPQRAKAVDFSKAYYFVNQSVVGRKGKPIATVRSVAGLKKFKLGAAIGTTSYDFIINTIKPELEAARLRHQRPRRAGAEERRRSTASSSTCRRRSTSPPCRSPDGRSSASSPERREGGLRARAARGNSCHLRQQGARPALAQTERSRSSSASGSQRPPARRC